MTKLQSLKSLLCAAGLAVASFSHAGVVPVGIQSNVSAATVAGWGWTECSRSNVNSVTTVAGVLSACNGAYLMMGYSSTNGLYNILGAGAYSAVTAATYADYNSDNGGTTLNNWSNGLNFYRTAGNGSWGFTTNTKTELNSADIFLLNGLQAQNGQTEGVLSAGLSFHLSGGNLNPGWAYNVTGNNFTSMYGGDRVFLQYTPNEVPEPGVFLLFGIGLLGLGLVRRRS